MLFNHQPAILLHVDKQIRRQLTLFVNKAEAREIEQVRKQFNPVQQRLIASHVTLCREEEIRAMDAVLANLQQPGLHKISIRFGPPTRFDNGKGVWLAGQGDNEPFQQLRLKILAGLNTSKQQEPHITLMHPRNSTCTDTIFNTIRETRLPPTLTFDTISLIEQADGGHWQVLETFVLE